MVPDSPPEAEIPKVHDLGSRAAEAPAASAREANVYFMVKEGYGRMIQILDSNERIKEDVPFISAFGCGPLPRIWSKPGSKSLIVGPRFHAKYVHA
jgi:hypothetical protein